MLINGLLSTTSIVKLTPLIMPGDNNNELLYDVLM